MRERRMSWTLYPVLLWLVLFIVFPLLLVSGLGFLSRGAYGTIKWVPTWQNFVTAASPLYGEILGQSVMLAVATALGTAVIGVPFALALKRTPKWLTLVLMSALMLPFLANFIVRIYGLRLLMHEQLGILGALIRWGWVPQDVVLNDSYVAVAVGMVVNYLPYMVWPLYVGVRDLDWRWVEAAKDLGASPWKILWRIILPLLKPHLASGFILVFIPVLGEYMIPDLLGGAKNALLGNVITDQFLKLRHWPLGAALTTLVNVALLVLAVGQHRLAAKAEYRA